MKKTGFSHLIEPFVIIVMGCWFLKLALGIKKNPMKIDNPVTNTFAQAKFLPALMAGLVILLGVALLIQKIRSNSPETSKINADNYKRLIFLLVVIAAYIIAVYKIGFRIPTCIYSVAVLFLLNYKTHKWYMILLAAAVFIVAILYVLPLMINVRLP